MSIILEKAERVGVILAKKGIHKAPIMRVAAAFDISTSMDKIIKSGKLQAAFNQLMGITLKFDDNGELDCFAFNHECSYVGTADPTNYETYVKKNFRANGATNYAPILREAMKFFFTPKRAPGVFGFLKAPVVDNTPVLLMVLTDGANDDQIEMMRAVAATAGRPIYIHLVGVGGGKGAFPKIAELAKKYDNVGEVYLPAFDMPDDAVYEQLITDKLVAWVKPYVVA